MLDVDEEWIVRVARSTEVADAYEVEQRLLRELAEALPVPVPVPERAGHRPAPFLVYRKLDGVSMWDEQHGEHVGAVAAELAVALRILHSLPVDRARTLGVPAEPDRGMLTNSFRKYVLPLLSGVEQRSAGRLLAAFRDASFEPRLIHGDLGAGHVLCAGGRVTGVLDWTDSCIGDPAVDLSWLLHRAPRPIRRATAAAYGVDDELVRRALVYHRIVGWYHVLHGLSTKQPAWVESGLKAVRDRLPD